MVQDLAYWSGLTVEDARNSAATLSKKFVREKIDGKEYIYAPVDLPDRSAVQTTFLMPDYDEYGMSYKDRTAIFDGGGTIVYNRMIVVDGRIAGTWRRTISGKMVFIETYFFRKLKMSDKRAVDKAIGRFCEFIDKNRNK